MDQDDFELNCIEKMLNLSERYGYRGKIRDLFRRSIMADRPLKLIDAEYEPWDLTMRMDRELVQKLKETCPKEQKWVIASHRAKKFRRTARILPFASILLYFLFTLVVNHPKTPISWFIALALGAIVSWANITFSWVIWRIEAMDEHPFHEGLLAEMIACPVCEKRMMK